MTIIKLFQIVKETRNRPKFYLWTLRKNDSSTAKNKIPMNASYLTATTYQ